LKFTTRKIKLAIASWLLSPKKLLTENHRIDRIRTHKNFVCPSLHLDDELVIVSEGIRHFMIRENLSGLYHGLLLHHFKITVTAAAQ
jgi:hypothetical protein